MKAGLLIGRNGYIYIGNFAFQWWTCHDSNIRIKLFGKKVSIAFKAIQSKRHWNIYRFIYFPA